MECLIFGGFGYLGSRVVDHIKKNKFNITIGTNNEIKKDICEFHTISNYRKLNCLELSNLISKFDLIIDCSGISGPKISQNNIQKIISVNSIWPSKLAKKCIELEKRLIWFSTIHCQKLDIKDQKSIKPNIYALSKVITESSIMDINRWDKFVNIIRLGNMLGAPGSCYRGISNLFPLEISRNLALKSKAIVKSDPNKKIAFVPISKLIKSNIFVDSGFHSISTDVEVSLYSIAENIKKSYELISGKKGEIYYSNFTKNTIESIPEELKREIDLMVNFFNNKNT